MLECYLIGTLSTYIPSAIETYTVIKDSKKCADFWKGCYNTDLEISLKYMISHAKPFMCFLKNWTNLKWTVMHHFTLTHSTFKWFIMHIDQMIDCLLTLFKHQVWNHLWGSAKIFQFWEDGMLCTWNRPWFKIL